MNKRTRVSSTAVSIVALAAVGLTARTGPAAAATPPVAATATTATGPVPTLPVTAHAVGQVSPSSPLQVAVSLDSRDPSGLQALATAVATPGSPSFRHFLTPAQVRDRFGAPAGAVGAVTAWLQASGLTVGSATGDGLLLPASGPAAAVEAAFATPLVQYRLPGGRIAYANGTVPRIPDPLAGEVAGVVGLDDLTQSTPADPGTPAGPSTPALPSGGGHPGEGTVQGPGQATGGPQPCAAASHSGGATANQIAHLDGLDQTYEQGRLGQGVTIGLYELGGYSTAAVSAYEQCYGTSTSVTTVPVDGGAHGLSGETTLDIEVAAGVAPKADILVYEAPNNPVDSLALYATIAQQDRAQVVSSSWGSCEPDLTDTVRDAEASYFEEMDLQGQSMFAAAGDEGSEDCDSDAQPTPPYPDYVYKLHVDDPASQPFVTGVGGTEIPDHTSGAPADQQVWNNTGPNGDGSGFLAPFDGTPPEPDQYPGNYVSTGGISEHWAQPAWQAGFDTSGNASGTPCAATAGADCREVPDVSALAGPPGYAITDPTGTTWAGYDGGGGGTSAASPMWASMTALADEGAPNFRLGLISPDLYRLDRSDPGAFTDVTVGQDNYLTQGGTPDNYTCTYGGVGGQSCYHATIGYDMASGLGTPVGSVLIPGLDQASEGVSNYDEVASDGGIFTFGTSGFFGSMGGRQLNEPVVGMATTPSGDGYWEAASDGGIFTFGDAGFFGSMGGHPLNEPVVGMASTPSGDGYREVASDGGIFTFGDAGFFGSMGGHPLDRPVVAIAPTPSGRGYWEVASDGGVFAFGDASFYGSMGGRALSAPVVGAAATPDGKGYWEVASDGGVFAFGDAGFYGSMGGHVLHEPVVAMAATADGKGYWEVASDGGIFTFGDAAFSGSMGAVALTRPVVAMTAG